MSNISNTWETVKLRTRRWSTGFAKSPMGKPDDDEQKPMKLRLGETTLVYEDKQWRKGKSSDGRV
ncbi:hypothetical protein EDD86DRAFT_198214 [Gorgonomyces haynaldii]|nr:hypothetical protein EDD86DRAFT_198214 [Gorgonomyces haynaldii]